MNQPYDQTHSPGAVAWVAASATHHHLPHATPVTVGILSFDRHGAAAWDRLRTHFLDDPAHARSVLGRSSIKAQALATLSALQQGDQRLAGSADGPAPHQQPVAVRPHTLTQDLGKYKIRTVFGPSAAPRPRVAGARRHRTVLLTASETNVDNEPALRLIVQTRAEHCDRCAVSALRRTLEVNLEVGRPRTEVIDAATVLAVILRRTRWLRLAPGISSGVIEFRR